LRRFFGASMKCGQSEIALRLPANPCGTRVWCLCIYFIRTIWSEWQDLNLRPL